MKAIAYNIQAQEKELLVRANAKRYKLTLISNGLNEETSTFCMGKEVVIVSQHDTLPLHLLKILKAQGILKIITRSHSTLHIDLHAASTLGLIVINLENNLNAQEQAAQIIDLLAP